MSAYVRISKKLGFERRTITMPTLEEALEIYKKAEDGDVEKFERIFEIYRFAGSPETQPERDVMAVIIDAFDELAQKFREME